MPPESDLTHDSASNLQPAAPAPELQAAELRGLAPLDPKELEQAAAGTSDDELLGQQRVLDAVRLAIGIQAPGYNLFATGVRGSAEREAILRLLREKAATMPTPGDWVYVNNFQSPEAPIAIYLKPGQGRDLRDRMTELVNYVREQLPKAFRQEDFDQERNALRDKYNALAQELFTKLEARAKDRGFAINAAPNGQLIFIPLFEGKVPESPEILQREMNALTEEQRTDLAKRQGELQEEFLGVVRRQQEIMQELVKDIRGIERAFASRVITPAVEGLAVRFENPAVAKYLQQVAEHMLSHLDRFRESAAEGRPAPENPMATMTMAAAQGETRFPEYQVNLFVDNANQHGAPVISENSPTYRNLFGTIERWADPMGRPMTNFTRIITGSFQKAHQGFLVIDLEDAIVEPGVWKTLKRSLKTGSMTIETFEPYQMFFSSGLKPEPIEIRNKVVVLGTRYLYNMLYFYDTDFPELFKIKAEIRPIIDAKDDAVRHYATRIAWLIRNEHLPPFDGAALARIVEFGMRLAGERGRVVTLMEPIDDLAREAAYFARGEGATEVTAHHVERALSERVLRLNYVEEELRRMITERVLVVDLKGAKVGQINGLAVIDVGGYAFGRPSRVTATVALGHAGIINIEREARLSGSTHDKGIMILSGFLRYRFGQEFPVAMSASICFEQSYSGIDGDSASSTELYALLSALSGVPIRQDLAVTGSVDQYGNVQAIGGANEKIESFYWLCKVVGLTGTQGVMVPRANINNLMLQAQVVEAVRRGEFHIYPIDHIDMGIELLTGVKAGDLKEPGTINYVVHQRLKRMAEQTRGIAGGEMRVIAEPASPPKPPGPPEPPNPPR
ncbi:MAG TPA: ATP-binding protein [Candidatus Binataceae bacterium]|jgi:predicted ATP-dependent protease|nr:ATP-binding protein [Candidatus Binataceae bacterium]